MTYDQLRAALNGYMHRTDPETVANEPNALELARVKLARTFFPELASASLALVLVDNTNGSAYSVLPPDFGMADVVYGLGVGSLEYITPREWGERIAAQDIGSRFTVMGDRLKTDAKYLPPAPGLVLTYYRQPAPIVGAASNWCSDGFPDVWLWQAIAEQHRFVQDFDSAAMSDGYAAELATVATVQTRANREGGVLRMTGR